MFQSSHTSFWNPWILCLRIISPLSSIKHLREGEGELLCLRIISPLSSIKHHSPNKIFGDSGEIILTRLPFPPPPTRFLGNPANALETPSWPHLIQYGRDSRPPFLLPQIWYILMHITTSILQIYWKSSMHLYFSVLNSRNVTYSLWMVRLILHVMLFVT